MTGKSNLLDRATDPAQYDRQDITWRSESDLDSPMRTFFWQQIMKHCPDWQGRRVLDIGAGSGWALDEAKKLGASTTIGIEPSAQNVRLSKRLFPRIQMVQGTFEDYRTIQRFDRIISIMSLPHIRNLEEAFARVRLLLAEPAGEFVAIVPDYDYYKRARHDYQVEIEELDSLTYVTSIRRSLGELVDIVRKEMAYVLVGEQAGLQLTVAEPMPPSNQLITQIPKYRDLANTPIMNFFKFSR